MELSRDEIKSILKTLLIYADNDDNAKYIIRKILSYQNSP